MKIKITKFKRMKRKMIYVFSILAIILVFNYPFTDNLSIKNDDCLIRNEKTAIKIAEAILFEHYGKVKIYLEKPFVVSVKNDSLWYIHGTSYTNGIAAGGVFHITFSALNGKVIEMYHDK